LGSIARQCPTSSDFERQFRSSRVELILRQGEKSDGAEGQKLLFSQPRKRAIRQPPDREPDLSTEERIRFALLRNLVLTADAKREQEENAAEKGRIKNERERFELARDKLYLALGLVLVGILFAAATALWLSARNAPRFIS
jgi:hypothetical protein